MDNERKRELREQYKNRRPETGVIGVRCGSRLWIAPSRDVTADRNSTLFQLDMGSFPNRELQKAYSKDPARAEYIVLKRLDLKDPAEDVTDDLQLLLYEAADEYPDAKPLKPAVKLK